MTAFITTNLRDEADAQRVTGQALVEGYHIAFIWGAVLLALALPIAAFVIKREA